MEKVVIQNNPCTSTCSGVWNQDRTRCMVDLEKNEKEIKYEKNLCVFSKINAGNINW